MLYLVRHAKAGSRRDWDGDDQLRPLSKAGRTQAKKLAKRLIAEHPSSLISSPYVRCMQTLEALALRLDTDVISDERLAEGDDFSGALELVETVPDGTVLCSHGDIIPATMAALERRGCRILSEPDWRKATVWVLTRERTGAGTSITTATVWPPPPH